MGRFPRFTPENKTGTLFEITVRVIGGRALLTPSPNPYRFNEIVVGVLGRAAEVSPVEICGTVVLGNHLHLLIVVHEQREMSNFARHFFCNLSKEVARTCGWSGAMWSRRYDAIPVSDDPQDQWARLKYLLSHGVKEKLVESPYDWPGVHSAEAIVRGTPLTGTWFNRTKEWHAKNQGKDWSAYDFATNYEVNFAPLPAFRHLDDDEYRAQVKALVAEIEEEGRVARGEMEVLGVAGILAQNPLEAPSKPSRSPGPRFHARDHDVRQAMRDELNEFLGAYWEASEKLRELCGRPGREMGFPSRCYPPALPYVGEPKAPRPHPPPTRTIEKIEIEGSSPQYLHGPIPVVVLPSRIYGLARGDPG